MAIETLKINYKVEK